MADRLDAVPVRVEQEGRVVVLVVMGPQARRIKRYAEALAATLTVAVDYFDESYSTAEAKAMRTARGRKKSNTSPKSPVDDLAAALILQNYLDAKHNKRHD